MKTEEKEFVLQIGQCVMCIKDCFQDDDEENEDEDLILLYKKGNEYVVTKQGFLTDEEGFQRQWKLDWFTMSVEFDKYFKLKTKL